MNTLKTLAGKSNFRNAKRMMIGGLAALALGIMASHPAGALPPVGEGGDGPPPLPKTTYRADLHFREVFKIDGYKVLLYIENIGNTSSTPCSVATFVYNNYGHNVSAKAYSVPAIKPGETAQVTVKFDYYLFLAGYTYQYWVDNYGQVSEFNENNNIATFYNPSK